MRWGPTEELPRLLVELDPSPYGGCDAVFGTVVIRW